ncbi:MAG: 30S ribosomal protein S21 [Planctomycetia bacterium]|nr:30S ribosomal protein S21 [Planctomycetia bacterium]
MLKVKSRGNETVDQKLRRFKKLCEKEGLIKDMKRLAYFEKPSEKRRRQLRKAEKRELKTLMEARGIAPLPPRKERFPSRERE